MPQSINGRRAKKKWCSDEWCVMSDTKGIRRPAVATRAAACPGSSVYCACHTKGSQEALCTVPACHTKGSRGPAGGSYRRLCVLRLPHERQPRASGGHARRSSSTRVSLLHLPHERQPRASGGHARGSSSRRLCVLRLPHERQPRATYAKWSAAISCVIIEL